MPNTWVAPESYMIHNGVVVYYAYKDDNRTTYHFTLVAAEDDVEGDGNSQFDVRELPTWKRSVGETEDERIAASIRAAIDTGFFADWEKDEPPVAVDVKANEEHYDNFLDEATHKVADMWSERGGTQLSTDELHSLNDLLTSFFDSRRS